MIRRKKRMVRTMMERVVRKLNFRRRPVLFAAGWMALAVLAAIAMPSYAQAPAAATAPSPAVPQWQTAAGGKLAFDVASVKQNKGAPSQTNPPYSNFPMGPGDMYSPNAGHFTARNWPLSFYIQFAYKMTQGQIQSLLKQLPDWASTDRFDIDARGTGDPGKDQMRLMMQALLAERFKLAIHTETQQLPVFALVLAKPGKTGPKLLPHAAGDTTCSNAPPAMPAPGSAPAPEPPRAIAGGFPVICGGLAGVPSSVPGRMALGYRNVAIPLIANQMPGFGQLDKPVIDETGLTGNFDFLIEFTPDLPAGMTPPPNFDTTGPGFLQALSEQDGLKLISQKGPVDVMIVDHVEHPSEN